MIALLRGGGIWVCCWMVEGHVGGVWWWGGEGCLVSRREGSSDGLCLGVGSAMCRWTRAMVLGLGMDRRTCGRSPEYFFSLRNTLHYVLHSSSTSPSPAHSHGISLARYIQYVPLSFFRNVITEGNIKSSETIDKGDIDITFRDSLPCLATK